MTSIESEVVKRLEQKRKDHVFLGYDVSFIDGFSIHSVTKGNVCTFPFVTPLSKGNYFDLASLTKTVTAVLLLKWCEKQSISLTTPFYTLDVSFKDQTVTLLHLLTHTAGLTAFIPNRNEKNKEELKQALYHLKPQYPVGSKVVYSDHHFLLLGFLLEKIYQESLETIVQKQINDPLHTHFTFFPPKKETVPTIPLFNDKKQWIMNLQGIAHDPKARIFQGVSGHAGLFATNHDVCLFLQALFFDTTFFSVNNRSIISTDQTNHLLRAAGFQLYKSEKNDSFLFGHTGYTGTFIIGDMVQKKGMVFLSNRVYEKDDRSDFILKRDDIIHHYIKGITT